ncbi:MAG TPA: pirin family protein [Terriglobia bacterium]|nr:pirin family protein [Terriglobia bacterium]
MTMPPPEEIETIIPPRRRDLGGFEVARILPIAKRQMVGPFIFLDQMGPTRFAPGTGVDVRPHPHIGLATVTYLFSGAILHKDSLGYRQVIVPGDVNWMTAGRGIAHSERTPQSERPGGGPLYGLQSWVALPREREEMQPSFRHYSADQLPRFDLDGAHVALIAGRWHGAVSPVEILNDLFYAIVDLPVGKRLHIPADHEERALHLLSGHVTLAGWETAESQMLVLQPGREIAIEALAPTRLAVLGGATIDGPRHIWWNFVSSSRDRIEQAKADWRADRFMPVIDETERIPLPEQ